MPQKKALLLVFCILITRAVFAQEHDFEQEEEIAIKPPQDFFVGITGGASLYSAYGYAYGGGLTIGYGTGSAFGLNVAWFISTDDVDTLEINLFLRFYLFGKNAYSGPYLQLMGGPAVFFPSGTFHMPAVVGEISGGLGFGWRFVLADRWFVEPFIRGGYPYLFGGGITAGIRL